MVSFGCTGGQHRSVYLAEQVAKRLQGRNGIEVVLQHRELERMEAENTQRKSCAMRAMILAAGLGTRLRPLTDDRPKALVEVAGRTLLEITLRRLREFGIREVIVNVHHFADMVVDYLKKNNNFGMRIEISREEVLFSRTLVSRGAQARTHREGSQEGEIRGARERARPRAAMQGRARARHAASRAAAGWRRSWKRLRGFQFLSAKPLLLAIASFR